MEAIAREQLFNTPVECGLRLLIILDRVSPAACDVDRLLMYDYILVHSGDVRDGPKSLHPPSPLQTSELIVRRGLLEKGLKLLTRKALAEPRYSGDGIGYAATELSKPFLSYFDSAYFRQAVATADWIAERFQRTSTEQMQEQVSALVGRWGIEFLTDRSFDEEV